ncbi:MAG: universal stress protein [Ornithinimicrobium sp.]
MTDEKPPVVVGYDGSDEADHAVDWAALEADRLHTGLVVLLATDTSDAYQAGRGHSPSIDDRAKAVAEAAADRARSAISGLSVEARVSGLGPAAALQSASATARLIVVGRRSPSPGRLPDALMGTVQFAVATHAECSVVVVPAEREVGTDPSEPVVVGVDGSEGSTLALREAATAASGRDAGLVILCAWKPRASWAKIPLTNDPASLEEARRARTSATETMKAARELVEREFPGLGLSDIVAEGRPSTLLARESDQASLVVVGARGNGDLPTLLLGSVGRNLIYRSECPVAIIR